MTTVTITDAPMSVEELLAVAHGEQVRLSDGVRTNIAAARAIVEEAPAGGSAVYGLTTQVGHGKDTRLSQDEIAREQQFLVMSHSGGVGPPLPAPVVRAALTVRLNGIARGGSGAEVAVADILAGMLNAGVTPVVPQTGSIGAGDLGRWRSWLRSRSAQARPPTRARCWPATRRCAGRESSRWC